MDEKHPEIIIVKRHSGHEDEHHGGAWKIAFADFMTAMMAFFLVLWIINATDKNTKTIIARYFNPLKLEDMAKAKKGIRQTSGDESLQDAAPAAEGSPAAGEPAKVATDGVKDETPAPARGQPFHEPVDSAAPQPHFSEQELFSNPAASLDQIAGKLAAETVAPPPSEEASPAEPAATRPANRTSVATANRLLGVPDTAEVNGFVDPFRASTSAVTSPNAEPPQPARLSAEPPPPPEAPVKEAAATPPASAAPPAAAPSAERHAAPATPAAAAAAQAAAAKLQSELAKEIRAETHAQAAPGVVVEATPEGLLISLTDEYNFGMFATGSAEPQAKVVKIMEKIAQALKARPGSIVVRGHTDARPYKAGTSDNWRLSSERAQMAYYMLLRGGLDEKRVERVESYADRRLRTPANPNAAENRRIEILLRGANP